MKNSIVLFILSFPVFLSAQNIGINGSGAAPDGTAMLDIVATDKGILIPRVVLTATNAAGPVTSPTTSLLVYNTATAGASPNNVVPGYYYWDGSKWVALGGGQGGRDWSLTGNAGTTPGTNFLGTTDNVDLSIYTNNTEKLRIQNSGNVGIGTSSPNELLDVRNGNIQVGYDTDTYDQLITLFRNGSRIGWLDNDLGAIRLKAENNFDVSVFNSDNFGLTIIDDGYAGIGTETPDTSSALDIESSNKGVLIPRVALTATNSATPVASPATSLLIYNTATAGTTPNNVVPGYYYWNGSEWVKFSTGNKTITYGFPTEVSVGISVIGSYTTYGAYLIDFDAIDVNSVQLSGQYSSPGGLSNVTVRLVIGGTTIYTSGSTTSTTYANFDSGLINFTRPTGLNLVELQITGDVAAAANSRYNSILFK